MKEVIIIQIADRPGFADFLDRLQLLDLNYSLDEIPVDVYENAKRVQVRTGSRCQISSLPPSPSPLSEDNASPDFRCLETLERPVEVFFPRDLLSHILEDCVTNTDAEACFSSNKNNCNSQLNTAATATPLPLLSMTKKVRSDCFQFLTTAREAFVILNIRLQQPL